MKDPNRILAARKPSVLRRYFERIGECEVPEDVTVPQNAQEAVLLGMSVARKKAYEDGLADGVDLGISIFIEVAEAEVESKETL